MADTTDFRTGFTMRHKNELWSIMEFQHVKPGKGPAFVRTRLKGVMSGKVIDETFRAGEKVEEVRLERRNYQYLYNDGEMHTFMNLETYDQVELHADTLGDLPKYVKESEICEVLLHEGKPLDGGTSHHGRTRGRADRSGVAWRHRPGRLQAGHPRDRPRGAGAAVPRGGHGGEGRYAHRQVHQPGLSDRNREAGGSVLRSPGDTPIMG